MFRAGRERQVKITRFRRSQHVTERPRFTGEPFIFIERHEDVHWPPSVGDDDRPILGSAFRAAKILIELATRQHGDHINFADVVT